MPLPRVYDLAKELGLNTSSVLEKLAELGKPARSGSSTISPDTANRLRAACGREPRKFPPKALGLEGYVGPEIFKPQTVSVRLKAEDHPRLFHEALKFAENRLLIISPWVSKSATKGAFFPLLEAAAKRGVNVDIAIGIGDDLSDSDQNALAKLINVSKRFPEKVRLHKWRSHEKVLIVDQSYIEGSFNWLSFAGVDKRYYRRERGTLIVDLEIANEVYSELLQAIKDEHDSSWKF